jgi:DNA polymerase-1
MDEVALWDAKSQLHAYQGKNVFDVQIAEFLLSDGRFVPTQEKLFTKYKVDTLDALAVAQRAELSKKPSLATLFDEIEMKLVPVLWRMEARGIRLDVVRLKRLAEEIDIEIKRLNMEILDQVGFEINLNSPTQIGNYLVEKEGVPLEKTRTGKYATGEQELTKHSNQFPIIQKILTYRGLAKLRSTYIDSLISKVDENGRIHTTYSQVAANTGRLASLNPNLQNIPVTSEYGQKIKSCFESDTGYQFVSFDYSQQELRILAHLTGEAKLIDAFNNSLDVHKTTASQLFNTPYDAVTKDQRAVGKTINFGIIYGMSSFGMSAGLNIPVEEAQKFIDTFYATYPKIRTYYDQYLKNAKIDGFAETMLGRRRYVFEYPGKKFIDNSMKRVLMNYPIQGSAADLMKKAMILLDAQVLTKYADVHMLLQIHDDLVFEIKDRSDDEFLEIINEIKNTMCTVHPLAVPVEVDIKVGTRWGEMQPL